MEKGRMKRKKICQVEAVLAMVLGVYINSEVLYL